MRISDWSSDVCSSDLLPPFDWLFLTDAGLETDLIYNQGIDLPFFASISLLRTESGRQALKDYYRPYLELAARHGAGFVLESVRWRASPDLADALGLTSAELDDLNVASVDLLRSDERREGKECVRTWRCGV